MRIAVVHSFYASPPPSGENIVVEQQVESLRRHGHEVELFDLRTEALLSETLYRTRSAVRTATGAGRRPDFGTFRPDVVHVHNLFPNYSRRWVQAVPYPVVATMHNFRPLCAAATFFRDGHHCTECLDTRSALPSVVHGCYRGRLRSVPLALGQRFEKDALLDRADQVIVLNPIMRDLYVRAGIAESKFSLIPNYVPDGEDRGEGEGGGAWLYAGRLTEEKGILDVVREWPRGHKLTIAGTGPLDGELARYAGDEIQLLGAIPRAEVQRLMRDSIGLVFPSKWFEGSPMVYAEAIASGTPVMAWPFSSVAGLVESDGSGIVVSDLATDLRRAEQEFPDLRTHCRAIFAETYSETAWVAATEEAYRRAIERRLS